MHPQTDAAPSLPEVHDLDQHPHEYDVPALTEFLGRVFHTEVGTPLVWYSPGKPGYPRRVNDMLRALQRTRSARPLYYGTASVHPTAAGELFNRRSQFAGLHVVVLDDIGTKVELDAIPEALREPSYVIESSAGNQQWGYVLSEPVRDLEAASTLVREIYASGVTDPGGAMPTKLVRLPDGVNGKPEHKGWTVRLLSASWRLWTPDELLAGVDAGYTWDAVLNDAETVQQRRKKRSLLPWAASQPEAPTALGVVDPVLEWLYETKKVVSDSGEWVTIPCPWRHHHTQGDQLSGYRPLGRDDSDFRGWHCFHGHCAERKTAEFLAWVAANGGPPSAVYDPSSPLVREWVYDPVDDCAYQVLGSPSLEPHSLTALRNVYRKKIPVIQHDGKVKLRPVTEAWLDHPQKIVVYGAICEPSTTDPLVEYDGRLRINSFRRPEWRGEEYEDDIEQWEQWLEYLIPSEDEREYFSDWLAAKFQDMSFRGCGIVMIAEAFGTGRGTLARMISALFGQHNVASVPWPVLVGAHPHNDWQLSPLAITHETLDATRSTNTFRAYESLKTVIETSPSTTLINPKHRAARTLPVYTSHILFSNHAHAIVLPEGDRRLYCISNPTHPAAPAFFTQIYKWLDTDWMSSVAGWLRERKPDMKRLLAPPPMTPAKEQMLQGGMSGLDTVLRALLERWNGRFIAVPIVRDALTPFRAQLRLDASIVGAKHIEHAVGRLSVATPFRISVGSRQVRVRLLKTHVGADLENISPGDIREELLQNAPDLIGKWIAETLEEM